MPIEYKNDAAVFREMVSVEEAEGLLQWLQDKAAAKVDLGDCIHLHPANLQVLMAAKSRVTVWPFDANLRAWIEPVLTSA